MLRRTLLSSLVLLLGCSLPARGQAVLVEAEAFEYLGGWVIDQQFMDRMGSPYILAHGLGMPVKDAATTVKFAKAGKYRLWVRTRDWVAPWKAPGAPGRFQVLIDGQAVPVAFGTEGAEWHWQDGGEIEIAKPAATIALHDLTGFEGRCDAILFSDDPTFSPPDQGESLAKLRRALLGLPEKPDEGGEYDLVIVGGGIAGTCAAITSARLGLKVALVQDRPILGGNNSSDVRVWLGGTINHAPYPRVGDIVRELEPKKKAHYGPANTAEIYEDDKREALVRAEKNITLMLNHRVNAAENSGSRINAVIAQDIRTARRVRLAARFFADCTGDGAVGALAGAAFDMNTGGHMGQSNLWNVIDAGAPAPFPRCPWAADLTNKPFPGRYESGEKALHNLGAWFWEAGFNHDPIENGEHIRDTNFRGMYGAWDALKNVDKKYPNYKINWSAHISGPRESRRLVGDVVLTKEDLLKGRQFEDGCVPCTWSIDVHVPDKRYDKGFEGDAFISKANFTEYHRPYWLPYRTLYSKNVENLFMAGRNISVTGEALGTVRVMRTTGMMGEVVGMAASIAKQHGTTPRGVYEKHLPQLKSIMEKGVGKLPPVETTRPASAKMPAPPAWLKDAGENVARSAKVTVSGSADGANPSLLNDGKADLANNATRWLSDKKLPAFIELIWDRPQTVSAVRITSGYNGGGGWTGPIRDFVIQRHDGAAWIDIPGTQTQANQQIDWSARFAPITTARLRILVTATDSSIARVWEVEAYSASR